MYLMNASINLILALAFVIDANKILTELETNSSQFFFSTDERSSAGL
jgi:hypothetical protein